MRLKPEIIFAVIALIVGLIIVFAVPPFYGCDEPLHFIRIYQISEGHMLADFEPPAKAGGVMPRSLLAPSDFIDKKIEEGTARYTAEDKAMLSIPLAPSEREFIDILPSAIYPPTTYIPQSIGVLVARIFDANLLWISYIARIFGLLFFIAIVFLAIRITPVFKNLIMFIALTPICLYQECVLSADTFINSMAFLLFALVIKFVFSDKKITWKQVLTLTIICIAITTSKQSYFPLALLCLLIPRKNFKSTREYIGALAAMIGIPLVFALGWMFLIRNIMSPLREGVSMMGQLAYIFAHPLRFIRTFLAAFLSKPGIQLLSESMGYLFGWPFPVRLPLFISIVLFITTIAIAALDGRKLDKIRRFSIFLIGGAGIAAIATIFYLTWNPVGSSIIEGMQGRYFIPYLLPLMSVFMLNKPQHNVAKWVSVGITLPTLIFFCANIIKIY